MTSQEKEIKRAENISRTWAKRRERWNAWKRANGKAE